jgi:hypothetical protein
VLDVTACRSCGKDSCDGSCAPAAARDDEAIAREAAHVILLEQELQKERVRREVRRRLDSEARQATPPPEILSLRERLTRPVQATTWRIEGWQPRDSRVMLAAQFKAGKTTLVGNHLRCLVDGPRAAIQLQRASGLRDNAPVNHLRTQSAGSIHARAEHEHPFIERTTANFAAMGWRSSAGP